MFFLEPILSPFHKFRPRNRFETERTYVPESRNNHSNSKHGVPMEELNGVRKNGPSPASVPSPEKEDPLIYTNNGQSEV